MGCYIWYSDEATEWGCIPPRPLLAVPNVHPPTPSVLITELLRGFNVHIKGLPLRTAVLSLRKHLSFRSVI